MSATSISSHGNCALQIKLTTSAFATVPLIFLKLTLLILTFNGSKKTIDIMSFFRFKNFQNSLIINIKRRRRRRTTTTVISIPFYHIGSMAILLIYDNWITDIDHYHVVEMHIKNGSNISCIYQCTVPSSDSLNGCFTNIPSQTSYTFTMSRPACYVSDCYLLTTISKWDTVISSTNICIYNINPNRRPMWIPSVLALYPGAFMLTCWKDSYNPIH